MRTLLIMAGGTGGHIMPGLAVAEEMRDRGWRVLWMGDPNRMEGKLVSAQGLEMEPLAFSGVRGKGWSALLRLPAALLKACSQAGTAMKRVRPDAVLGMGGYVAFPGGLVAAVRRLPLVIHEQNAVAGTANRWLARVASKVLAGFPGALRGALVVGNPVRRSFTALGPVEQRYLGRSGPLRVLVLGGSQGARAINQVLPEALGLMDPDQRPQVRHQSGAQHLESLVAAYARAGVAADCETFIDNVAAAMGEADLIICRAGAMAVAEVAAAGVAALFVPLPHAIDDHQTANARYLSACEAAWLCPEADFSAAWLAQWLAARDRGELAAVAAHAHEHARPDAARMIADACEQVARRPA